MDKTDAKGQGCHTQGAERVQVLRNGSPRGQSPSDEVIKPHHQQQHHHHNHCQPQFIPVLGHRPEANSTIEPSAQNCQMPNEVSRAVFTAAADQSHVKQWQLHMCHMPQYSPTCAPLFVLLPQRTFAFGSCILSWSSYVFFLAWPLHISISISSSAVRSFFLFLLPGLGLWRSTFIMAFGCCGRLFESCLKPHATCGPKLHFN